MNALLNALRVAKNIAAWKINAVTRESCELFYVQKKVETIRATDTVDYSVTVYIDKDGKRGQSTFSAYPYMGEEEISKLIDEAVFAAGFTLNKFFELPKPEDAEIHEGASNLAEKPFKETIGEIGKAIMKANCVENGSLSATEIFLYKTTKHVVNSNGVDVASTSYECRIETIPNFVHGDEEVELYQEITFSEFNPDELTAKVAETLKLCKDRSIAIPMPKVDVLPVIIQDEEAAQFFGEFIYDLSYRTAFSHANRFNPGDDIQQNPTGDTLDVEMRSIVEGALQSSSVDEDGVILSPAKIIESGKAVARFGSFRFGYYLGEEHPTGSIPVAFVKEGTMEEADFKKAPYLRCVRFSGMQCDLMAGFFGGEVRLGYYFDGEKEIPVTGLSIQGNLLEAKDTARFSKQRVTLESYSGPKYIYVPNVKIS